MSTSTQQPAPRQDGMDTAPILDQLLKVESDIQRILRTPGARRDFPQACNILDSLLNGVSSAYIKFNEGDDKE